MDLAREDYYTKGGEPPGVWWGRGARRLGLTGSVSKDSLSCLFRGLSPRDTSPLVSNAHAGERCAGFDLTFSAVKSLSAIWAVGYAELRHALSCAHREAVEEALRYLEDNAAFTRTGAGGRERARTRNLCAALFEHSTSRAQDPNLHTHALVLNFTESSDRRTRTLDGREIYRHKMAAGALYRAHLSGLLERRLGLRVRREESWFEVEGVPRALLEHFSKRRQAILTSLTESGAIGTSAEAAIAALETRAGKESVPRSELFSRWRLEAKAFEFEEGSVRRTRGLAIATPCVRDVVSRSVERLTERQSYFSRRELLRYAAEESQGGGLSGREIRNAVWAYLGSAPEILRLSERERERQFTTKEMYDLERRMLEAAVRLSKSAHHEVREESIEAAVGSRETLSTEQEAGLRSITRSVSLSVVSGMAGTGKSYMLGAAREAFEREGKEVLGVCLAAIAAERLEEETGIRSGTLHGFLRALGRRETELSPRAVVVLDEAAMVGTRQMATLLFEVERTGAKLILVGDERQLQPIEAGLPFGAIGERLGRAELRDIRRQNHEWAAEAVREFARGKAGAALRRFADRGLLRVEESRARAMARLAGDWTEVAARDPKDTLVLAGTNAEVRALNRLCQDARAALGGVLGRSMTAGQGVFHEGDRVLFTRNTPLVRNGSRGTITRVVPECGSITVLLDSGERVTLEGEEQLEHVQLGYAMTVHKAQGATVERAFVLVGGGMQDREASYVQASRIREEARLYGDEWTAGEKLRSLVRDMARSRRKELAHSLEVERN